MPTLYEQADKIKAEMQSLVDRSKAANRDLTAAEARDVERMADEHDRLTAQARKARKATEFVEGLASGDPAPPDGWSDAHGPGAPGLGGLKRLDFRGLSARIARGMKAYTDTVSPRSKGLVPAGETVVDVPLVNATPTPGEGAQETPPRLLDALPVVVRPGPVYSFLRQTVIADPGAAGVVPPGELKPTLRLGIQRVDAELKVVAVLSEPIDRYLLLDAESLATWVRAELADAVQAELERQVLSGTGLGTDFTGLASTSGVLAQPFVGDPLVTVQHGLSRLEALGVAPTLIALAPADWLVVQTTRNASGGFDVGGPIDATARSAWGTPVVLAAGLAPGTGYVIGADSVVVATDGRGLRVDWAAPGDAFQRNELVARVEGRFSLDVTRPHGVVQMDLTAV